MTEQQPDLKRKGREEEGGSEGLTERCKRVKKGTKKLGDSVSLLANQPDDTVQEVEKENKRERRNPTIKPKDEPPIFGSTDIRYRGKNGRKHKEELGMDKGQMRSTKEEEKMKVRQLGIVKESYRGSSPKPDSP